MDKYKRLVSNTMLFAISTFSSKLLSFVMAPLFSYWFETQEMNGIKELLNQCASLLIPLVSLVSPTPLSVLGWKRASARAPFI